MNNCDTGSGTKVLNCMASFIDEVNSRLFSGSSYPHIKVYGGLPLACSVLVFSAIYFNI